MDDLGKLRDLLPSMKLKMDYILLNKKLPSLKHKKKPKKMSDLEWNEYVEERQVVRQEIIDLVDSMVYPSSMNAFTKSKKKKMKINGIQKIEIGF